MRSTTVFVLSISSALLLLVFIINSFIPNKSRDFISPIGKRYSNQRVKAAELWFPEETTLASKDGAKPKIFAQSALSFDLSEDTFLYKKDMKSKRAIASLTKIMTAIIALEENELSDVFYVSEYAANVGEDSMGLSEGETYTLEELLYGVFLASGNDAAEVIAENVAGDREMFIEWMNNKAYELGLDDTHFINPSGLPEGDEENYSSAFDVLLMTRYAIYKFPVLKKIASTKYYEILYSEDHKYLFLENETNLLGTYPGVFGFKTGYTEKAGLCLVTTAENGGHKLITIVLGSTDRRYDVTQLLDYSFGLLGVEVKHNIAF